jgi:hypothetical protein
MVNTSFGCVNHPFAGGDSAMLLAGRMGANRLPVLGNDVIERSSSPTDDVIKCSDSTARAIDGPLRCQIALGPAVA